MFHVVTATWWKRGLSAPVRCLAARLEVGTSAVVWNPHYPLLAFLKSVNVGGTALTDQQNEAVVRD